MSIVLGQVIFACSSLSKYLYHSSHYKFDMHVVYVKEYEQI